MKKENSLKEEYQKYILDGLLSLATIEHDLILIGRLLELMSYTKEEDFINFLMRSLLLRFRITSESISRTADYHVWDILLYTEDNVKKLNSKTRFEDLQNEMGTFIDSLTPTLDRDFIKFNKSMPEFTTKENLYTLEPLFRNCAKYVEIITQNITTELRKSTLFTSEFSKEIASNLIFDIEKCAVLLNYTIKSLKPINKIYKELTSLKPSDPQRKKWNDGENKGRFHIITPEFNRNGNDEEDDEEEGV